MFFRMFRDPALSRFVCMAEGDPNPAAADPAAAGAGAGGGGSPAPADPAAADPAADPAAAAAAPEPKPQDWKDKQIARQHRKIKELESAAQRAAELEAENRRLQELAEAGTRRAPAADPTADPAAAASPAPARPAHVAPQQTPAAPDKNALKNEARFEVEVEQIQHKIAAEYANEWKTAEQNFQQAGGINVGIMQSVLATDDPAYVLVKIGTDPDLYQELLDMTPQRAAARLIKIGMEKSAASAKPAEPPKRPSGAPAPVDPVRAGGAVPQVGGSVNLYDPSLADDRWYAERMRQKRESQGRLWSLGGRAGGH